MILHMVYEALPTQQFAVVTTEPGQGFVAMAGAPGS